MPPPLGEDYAKWLSTGSSMKIALVRNGNAAANTLGGTQHGDVFSGAGGNDILIGYQGRDVYSFNLGDGADTIVDHSPEGNVIKLRDVPEASVRVTEVPGFAGETDRLIAYGDSDAIRIVGWSRLSPETRSAWEIEHFFRPPPDPDANRRPHPLLLLLSDPKSLLLILALLAVSFLPLFRYLRRRS